MVAQWRGIGLAIDKSWVQFPPGQCCITTLEDVNTYVLPVAMQYNLVLVEGW